MKLTHNLSRTLNYKLKRLLLIASIMPVLAFAQAWPTKQPIKLVAVFPPGGSVDQVARILAQSLSQQLGQSVVVENKAGASGVVGTQAMATARRPRYARFWPMRLTHPIESRWEMPCLLWVSKWA